MLIFIGFGDEELDKIKKYIDISDIFSINSASKTVLVSEIINNIEKYVGDGNWHTQKFVLMHELTNQDIKNVLSVFKQLGMKDVIFATTTPTSLNWTLQRLLDELIEEHEYFKNRRAR